MAHPEGTGFLVVLEVVHQESGQEIAFFERLHARSPEPKRPLAATLLEGVDQPLDPPEVQHGAVSLKYPRTKG
jgi:hypothetical protein